ncbi:hypothetical protein U9M48_031961 [Paspalum notatum var. saurae]|uniref:Uncharacterized protein n=1 Tax=Paspalum notatum var. saurae TaxID=547442 RepID=A0AAQ3X4X0_PASNO
MVCQVEEFPAQVWVCDGFSRQDLVFVVSWRVYSSSSCRSSKALRVPSSIKPSTQGTYSRSLTWVTLNP